MTIYESDLTKFMREYLDKHPEEKASQAKGRAIWWDHAGPERTAPGSLRHSPRAGGNEYLFKPLSDDEQETK